MTATESNRHGIGCSSSGSAPSRGKKWCVDIGAWDGKHLSNTYNLCFNNGWSGALFEANKDRCIDLQTLYKDHPDVKCVDRLVEFDGPSSLSNCLLELHVPLDFEFLSIDVDGADYHVWRSLENSYRPKVVCIEFNPTIPNRIRFVQDADMRVYQGSSLLAITELGSEKGYTLIACTLYNAFFLRNDLLPLLPSFDRSIDALHANEMSTDFFQTYDGELKFFGTMKLLWHRLPLNTQKLQLLPKNQRKFPFAPPVVDELTRLRDCVRAVRLRCERETVEALVRAAADSLAVPYLEGHAVEALQVLVQLLLKLQARVPNTSVVTVSCDISNGAATSVHVSSSSSSSSNLKSPETAVGILDEADTSVDTRVWLLKIASLFVEHATHLTDRNASDVGAPLCYYLKAYHTLTLSNRHHHHHDMLRPVPTVGIDEWTLVVKCVVKISQMYLRQESFIECQSWIDTLDCILKEKENDLCAAEVLSFYRVTYERLRAKLDEKWHGLFEEF